MGYTTRRKLKKQYIELVKATEILLMSSSLMQKTLKSRISLLESKIDKLEKTNKYLSDKVERYNNQFDIDWKKMDEEIFDTGRRGRHSKPRW